MFNVFKWKSLQASSDGSQLPRYTTASLGKMQSENTGNRASRRYKRVLMETRTNHVTRRTRKRTESDTQARVKRLSTDLGRVGKGLWRAVQWLKMNKTRAFDDTGIKRPMIHCAWTRIQKRPSVLEILLGNCLNTPQVWENAWKAGNDWELFKELFQFGPN